MTLDSTTTRSELFNRLATKSGGFAMVAMDQRESLRTMMAERTDGEIPDALLVQFKLAVVETLSPHASALLIDTQWGLQSMLEAHSLDPRCGLIVAADALEQVPGEAVTGTSLDRSVDPAAMREAGAVALKLLVIVRPDDPAEERAALIREFVEASHGAGLLALVEPVVRPPRTGEGGWDREASVLAAAREIGPLGADIYKGEVPYYGKAAPDAITRRCEEMTAVLPCPWVVLSQGVAIGDFPAAVEAACAGGASGFLAGRGVWSDVVGREDVREGLREVSVPRLEALRATVEEEARPWWEATG